LIISGWPSGAEGKNERLEMAQQIRIQIWVIVALIFIIWMHSAEPRALGAEGEEITWHPRSYIAVVRGQKERIENCSI
jgi:hypothetical protein